ncbi:MAG: hypothetical protein AAF899_20495 [Pseudomonadota bacterium]
MIEWVQYVVLAVLLAVPMWRLLPRAGLSPYLSFVALLPFGIVALLWVMAFRRWPGDAAAVRQ